MSRWKPSCLYEYEGKRLRKQAVLNPEGLLVINASDPHGIRFCQGGFYGYGRQREAKAAEIERTKRTILEEQEWLRKLEGRDGR